VRPLVRDEIVPLDEYAGLRADYRDAVIAHKRNRRMPVGDRVTLLFEDRETLRFQVQEMLWVERIVEPTRIQNELDVYNELMPGPGELSATLFIEITDMPEIRPELDRLIGLDEQVALVLRSGEETDAVPARFDESQMEEDRISAVHYLRFTLQDAQVARLAEAGVRASMRVTHPNYSVETDLDPALRQSLIRGLRSEPTPLLERDPARPTPSHDTLLREGSRVRVVRPSGAGADHVVVEPIAEIPSLLAANPELLTELMLTVQAVATELAGARGSCRIRTDIGGSETRLRWHVHALEA
jgi:hypothetical protein